MSPLTGPRHPAAWPPLVTIIFDIIAEESGPEYVLLSAVSIPCNILWLSPVVPCVSLTFSILVSCLPSTCEPVTSCDGQQCGARLELCCYILLSYQLTSQTSTHCLPHSQPQLQHSLTPTETLAITDIVTSHYSDKSVITRSFGNVLVLLNGGGHVSAVCKIL